MAYLVVRCHAVDHRPAQRVRYHRQVIRMVVQPLALQVFILRLRLCLASRTLRCQHSCLRVALRLVKSGLALSGCFLAAQVIFKCQRRMVGYLPRCQLTHQPAGETFRNACGGAPGDIILFCVVAIFRPSAVEGFVCYYYRVIIIVVYN